MNHQPVITAVARIVAQAKVSEGVSNAVIQAAGMTYCMSGTARLRDLARFFRCIDGNGVIPYFYRSNRYYPTQPFKRFCSRYARGSAKKFTK